MSDQYYEEGFGPSELNPKWNLQSYLRQEANLQQKIADTKESFWDRAFKGIASGLSRSRGIGPFLGGLIGAAARSPKDELEDQLAALSGKVKAATLTENMDQADALNRSTIALRDAHIKDIQDRKTDRDWRIALTPTPGATTPGQTLSTKLQTVTDLIRAGQDNEAGIKAFGGVDEFEKAAAAHGVPLARVDKPVVQPFGNLNATGRLSPWLGGTAAPAARIGPVNPSAETPFMEAMAARAKGETELPSVVMNKTLLRYKAPEPPSIGKPLTDSQVKDQRFQAFVHRLLGLKPEETVPAWVLGNAEEYRKRAGGAGGGADLLTEDPGASGGFDWNKWAEKIRTEIGGSGTGMLGNGGKLPPVDAEAVGKTRDKIAAKAGIKVFDQGADLDAIATQEKWDTPRMVMVGNKLYQWTPSQPKAGAKPAPSQPIGSEADPLVAAADARQRELENKESKSEVALRDAPKTRQIAALEEKLAARETLLKHALKTDFRPDGNRWTAADIDRYKNNVLKVKAEIAALKGQLGK